MNNKWSLELIGWGITLVVVLLILLPIYQSTGGDFLFYIENIASIVIFMTLARWIFLLRHTFFGWNKRIKAALIFLMIPLFFICYDNLIDFQAYVDEIGINTMLGSMGAEEQKSMARYIKFEYVFFGTAAIICVLFMPIRMIISLWRQVNKAKV